MKLIKNTQKLFDDLNKQCIKCNERLNIILNNSFENDEETNKRVNEFDNWYTQDLSSINNTYLKKKGELENLKSQYNLYISNQQKSTSNIQRLILEDVEKNFKDEINSINEDTANLIQNEKENNSQIINLENQKTTKINTQKSIRDTIIDDTNRQFNGNIEKLKKQQHEELDSFEKLKTENIATLEQFKEDMKSSYKKVQSLNTLK